MITVLLNDNGETVRLDAKPEDVTIESNALVVRRDRTIIARFRRHIAWFESAHIDSND